MRRRELVVVAAIAGAALALTVWPRSGNGDAPAGHYVITDGTVRDTKTGLVWQQIASTVTQNWTSAKSYCAGLTGLPGSGWRLPTIKELETIIDFSRPAGPYIDPTAFPGVTTSISNSGASFWSATTSVPGAVPGRPVTIWSVYFLNGLSTNINEPVVGMWVRCVR